MRDNSGSKEIYIIYYLKNPSKWLALKKNKFKCCLVGFENKCSEHIFGLYNTTYKLEIYTFYLLYI